MYFDGGDIVFGLNYGFVKVYMLVLFGYFECCLNVGWLLINLIFMIDEEN